VDARRISSRSTPEPRSWVVIAGDGGLQRRIEIGRLFPQSPTGLIDVAPAPDGRLVVVDNLANRVLIMGAEGLVLSFGKQGARGGEFSAPTFCSIDEAGQIFLADALNGRVQVFDSVGGFQRAFGRYGQGPGAWAGPRGGDFLPRGNLRVGLLAQRDPGLRRRGVLCRDPGRRSGATPRPRFAQRDRPGQAGAALHRGTPRESRAGP